MQNHQLEANRRNWDERARVHARSEFYDVEGFVSGRRKLWLHPSEPEEIGDVRGKSLCHLQCHLGVETLSWARLGAARVVGLDLSRDAIETAQAVAARCNLQDRARFVQADVHDAPKALAGLAPFDIVYVSVGAICWLPKIRVWASIVRELLAPSGILYLRESHSILSSTRDDGGRLVLDSPYFETDEPMCWDDGTTYTEGNPQIENRTCFEWNHSLAEIIQAILDQGLTLELLHEHRDAEYQALQTMSRGDDGLWRLPIELRDRLPLTFSLRARLSG